MKLLIIDDDSVSTFVSTWAAKNSGIFRQIQSVETGRQGLELLEQASHGKMAVPDIILLDLNMPVMSGFEVMEHMKAMCFPGEKTISVVILTSSDNPEDIQRSRSLGAEDYLVKPLSVAELQARLVRLQIMRHADRETPVRPNTRGNNSRINYSKSRA